MQDLDFRIAEGFGGAYFGFWELRSVYSQATPPEVLFCQSSSKAEFVHGMWLGIFDYYSGW